MALRPLDPAIVNAYQPPKFNMPDPLQDVAALEQIKSGRVSRQLNEQQLAQLQRDSTALDEMRKFIASKGGPENLDVAADAMINTGIPNVMDAGIKIKQKLNFQKNFNLAMGGGIPAPAQPAPVATTAPIQGPVMSVENLSGGNAGIKMRPILPEQAPAPAATNALMPSGFPTNFGENTMAQLRQLERQRDGLSMLAAENPQITPMVAELSRQIAELRRPQTFSPGQTVYVPGQPPFTLPPAPQRPVGLSRGETMVDPATGRIIAQGAAPETPPPTIVNIVDPKDPTRMIAFDARSNRVIGESGKEPQAVVREAKAAAGKNELASELDNIRIAYDNLNRMRAIPSTGRNVLSNIAAGTAASGVGQTLGRLAGTPEQTERDVIKSGRLRLVNAIKNATGMSAQQLNSNVELKNMLDSVTDPSQSIETVNRILDQIQETYLTGAAPSMGRPAAPAVAKPAAPAAGRGKPSVDDLLKKYGGG